ncbi:hypothetical protein POM88_011621 [Heracleum sosnowskyi]|uniref:Uncharacterized protein n=1 Tax=Heracleum sosnowskyi TaxID=360622 RepID=A0AAD8MWM8_9APIA|nr:hypothetical protein POM88_011621 [Heracleum sosnowskyi]
MCFSTLTNHSTTDYGPIVDKESRLVDESNENGSTLDHFPHLNQVATNVGNWDPWPQSKQGDSGMYMLSYAEYYATMPYFPQGELDIGAHRRRLAFLFLFLSNDKANIPL